MKINKEIIKAFNPCREGYEWYLKDGTEDSNETTEKLIVHNLEWANWLTARLLSKDNKISYAIFAAEQVLCICEEKYPEDKRPRKAIEAAQAYLENQTEENSRAANAAADAATNATNAVANAAFADTQD